MIEPAIVVIAYNRVEPLKRLLKSLSVAHYPSDNITLHISIDASDNNEIKEIADNFEWKHGQKVIDLKEENLGLLKHVLKCGQLTERYNSIIVLEDDLFVAPGFYQYAQSANEFYSKDEKVAGISLFTYPVEENSFYPFQPINDGSDVHFIQVASSWGQSWNWNQWSSFKEWLTKNPKGKEDLLPEYILEWGNNSWKKLFISYLVDTDRYFVFPNTSYSSNFEEEGTHATNMGLFQVPMNIGSAVPRFNMWNDSNAVYDVYFELFPDCLKRLNPSLNEYDFEVDIYGTKPIKFNSEFVLTSRRCKTSVLSFGEKMKPIVQNVLHEIEGRDISLSRIEDITLTEDDRFLQLSSSDVQLNQYSKAKKQKREQVSLILPVMDSQLNGLSVTLGGLKLDRFYNVTVLIVCSPKVKGSIDELMSNAPVNLVTITASSQELDEMLRIGISNCGTDYCGWIQPGMKVDLNKMESVAQIFQRMSQVQVLHGVQQEESESNYAKLNVAKSRWTPQTANASKSDVVKTRTEFVFWRTSLVSDDFISKVKSSTIFLELLKLNPIYVVARKLGDLNSINPSDTLSSKEAENLLSGSDFQPKSGVYSIVRPIFQFWFRRNVPFFRLFYKDAEQLPLVIRYDFKNDNYYLANY